MTRSGQVPASPAADFPLYGLDASWPGARWLDGFGDVIGEEVRWVRLAHQSLGTGAVITVGTHSRSLTDAQAAYAREHPLQSVAFAAAFGMVNLTLPAVSVPRPTGLLRALADYAEERSRRYAEWPSAPWQVDGVAVPVRVWRFADGWAMFSDAMDGVYLVAAGSGIGPDGLALAALRDGHAYNFDLDQPLNPRAAMASSAARAGGERLRPQRQDWHADQMRLVRDRA